MSSTDETHEVEHDLSLGDALALAQQCLLDEQHDDAQRLLRAVLAQWPGQPDALHYLGVLQHRRGHSDAALSLIRQALAQAPDTASMHNNLGNVLVELSRYDEAATAYREALRCDPDLAETHNNLGTIARKQERWAEAEAACRRAVQLVPEFADAWYNLSLALMGQQRIAEGVQANSRAIALWPRHLQARGAVARALAVLGETEQAIGLYRQWLAEEPDNPVVQHHLAACLAADNRSATPARASDAYVETVFDGFAASFDAKLASLNYRAPELVAQALVALLPPPERQHDIADVGCGTGLVGPWVRQWARYLAGCDLSVGMLRRAKQRGVYDALHKAELVHYLDTQPARFDVILSADTLCYFGDLAPPLAAARQALRPGGRLVFTVEATQDGGPGFSLQPHGRYAHARTYAEQAIASAGFAWQAIEAVDLRMEAGQPVRGWLVSACV
jgi:predicted TPR repeat methyltransferase